jgi:hypothetical protein
MRNNSWKSYGRDSGTCGMVNNIFAKLSIIFNQPNYLEYQ